MGFLDRLTGTPQDRFAAQVLDIARKMPQIAHAEYDRAEFALKVRYPGSASPARIFLGNLYAECQGASSSERHDRIARMIRVMADSHGEEDWDAVRPRLRPVLRYASFGQTGPAGMVPPLSRPALPHLRELVVVDLPESMSYVSPGRLDTWGVTADEVYALARANLREIADESLARDWPGPDTLLRMIDDGDGYLASLPLVPGWLAGVGERMGGPVVAFVPDPGNVLIVSIGDGRSLKPVFELVEDEYRDAPRSISPVGYTAGPDGRTIPYLPPPGHPDHVPARRAAALLAMDTYGAQTRWLTQQYAEAGIDEEVAELFVAGRPGHALETVTRWTDGRPMLLPKAELILFGDDLSDGALVPWDDVMGVVGVHAEPLMVPQRWRVSGWSAESVLSRLG